MNYVYWIRISNAILGGLVVGLCFLKLDWRRMREARNIRILGLGVLTLAITWGSLARRYDVFRPWLPLVTIGLILCVAGMRRSAMGEHRR